MTVAAVVLVSLTFCSTGSAAEKASDAPAIVGGSLTSTDRWPWAAFVAVYSDDELQGFCSGSLIGQRWVLTAAHCGIDGKGNPLPNLTFLVALGHSNTSTPPSDSIPAVVGSEFGYDPVSDRNDVLALRLGTPAPQQAIRLVAAGDAPRWKAGTRAVIVGWGTAEGDLFDYQLRQAAVPIDTDRDCASAWGLQYDPATMLCAGPLEGGADACEGDSGGPLMVPDGFSGWLEVGLTSFGTFDPCGQTAGVYTRIARYTRAIVAALARDPIAPIAAPAAVTGAATVSDSGVAIAGSVTPGGLATSYRIDYGPGPGYGSSALGYAGDAGPVGVSATLPGLKPGTTYHYRVVAVSAAGTAAGADATFVTSGRATTPTQPTQPTEVDTTAPTVHALPSRGQAGEKVRLLYRVWDDLSARTSERVVVHRSGGAPVWSLTTRLTASERGKRYYVSWPTPRSFSGAFRFCVTSSDASGNRSSPSCARVVVR